MAKNTRNDRNNPYLIEGLMVDFHRSKAGIAWRWRTELSPPGRHAGRILPARGDHHRPMGGLHPGCPHHGRLGGPALAPVHHPARLVPDLPAPPPARVLRDPHAHPRRTPPPHPLDPPDPRRGTRLHLVPRGRLRRRLRRLQGRIGSACYAREARVIRSKKHSHFVTLDIVRHDPLTADVIIASRIPRPAPASTTGPGQDTSPDVIEPTMVIPPQSKVREPAA